VHEFPCGFFFFFFFKYEFSFNQHDTNINGNGWVPNNKPKFEKSSTKKSITKEDKDLKGGVLRANMMERRREGKKRGEERSSKTLELLSHGKFDGGSCRESRGRSLKDFSHVALI
jgi:hypothetical protein